MEIQTGYLDRYLELNSAFAKTLKIKFSEAAALTNEGLIETYGSGAVNLYDPSSWKYYLNLSGQYHPTDEVMSLTSIDTLETIEFTLENLKYHPATAKAYAYGTRLHQALVYQYPQHESLIDNILNPCDIETAISAENGTVLSYPPELIEPQESSLILEIQDYAKHSFSRWFNAQFAMSDNLYCAEFISQLHMLIYPKLLNLRLKRCKTEEAHSFHIQMYLSSHGRLDRYLPYMTLKQKLWLYRNICQLERNPGKVSQFLKLIRNILDERNIPIGEYSIRHLDSFTDGWPDISARLKMISTTNNVNSDNLITLEKVHSKETMIEQGNEAFNLDKQENVDFRLKTSPSSVIQTKLLESSMVDYTDAVPESFESVVIREWCSLAYSDLFTGVMSFKDPKTSEIRTLSPKDAFFYMLYIASGLNGQLFDDFPSYNNARARLITKPTYLDLLSVVPYKEVDLEEIAKTIVSRQPIITLCASIEAFNAYARKVYNEAYWHWFLISSQHQPYERGLVENMVNKLYSTTCVDLRVHSGSISDWLEQNNLPVYNYSREEAALLIGSVYEAGTGDHIDESKKLKNIQKNLIDLVKELSSYTIRIITEINDDDIILLNYPSVRVDNLGEHSRDSCRLDPTVETFGISARGGESIEIDADIALLSKPKEISFSSKKVVPIDPSSTEVFSVKTKVEISIGNPGYFVDITCSGQNETLEEARMLPGYTVWNNLSETTKATFKSKYQ